MYLYLYYFGSILLVLLYVKLIFDVYSEWQEGVKNKTFNLESNLPTVTVIVAARNEADGIAKTIDSILANDYPSDKWELVVVNDHSTDSTVDIVNKYKSVILVKGTDGEATGKKAAITAGVKIAAGEIILTTDADCIVGDQWIKTIVKAYDDTTKVTTAMVYFGDQEDMLPQFQQMDLLSTMGITYYGISTQKFYTANGANFSFRKSAFEEFRGYEGNLNYASGDDMFFIQKVASKEANSIKCILDKKGIVATEPMTSFTSFLEQRKRWATKSKAYQEKGIYYPMGLVFLLNLSILINIALIPFFQSITLFIVLMQLMIKCIIDYLYLYNIASHFNAKFTPLDFFVCSALYPFYMLYMGFAGFFLKTYRWKGRSQQ